jgi:hypothetical protein
MYVVRETFIAKPGQASKLATMMKEAMTRTGHKDTRVMTDVVGGFNTVVMETEVTEFAEFERRMKEYGERPDIREAMKGYTDLYQSGSREIYRVL